MQRYFFIGSYQDGLNPPVPDDSESIQAPVGRTGDETETYFREILSVGDASITIYRHESLTSEQALVRLIAHYTEGTLAMIEKAGRECAMRGGQHADNPFLKVGEDPHYLAWNRGFHLGRTPDPNCELCGGTGRIRMAQYGEIEDYCNDPARADAA
jgi:hypothetical protein